MKNIFKFLFGKNRKYYEIDSFQITDADSQKNLLQFNRAEKDLNMEEWIQIPQNYSDNLQKYISLSGQIAGTGAQIGTIAALVPNGLYTATVNPALLMTYSNSTIGSSIVGINGQITGHAGFASAAGAVFAPILIFQAMSLITGHYYMNGISRQLTFIDKKLREIIELHHIERVAKIRYCRRIFKELSEKQIVNVEDMIQFQNAMTRIGVIHEEYSEQINRINIKEIKNIDANLFWTSDKIGEFLKNDDNCSYKLKIAVLTDELYHMGKIIELHLNTKMMDDPERRNLRVNELMNEIKEWNENNFYFNRSGGQQVEEYYQEAAKTLKNIYYNAVFHDDQADMLIKNNENRHRNFHSEICEPAKDNIHTLLNISKKLTESLASSKQILLSKKEGGISLYMKKIIDFTD